MVKIFYTCDNCKGSAGEEGIKNWFTVSPNVASAFPREVKADLCKQCFEEVFGVIRVSVVDQIND